MGPVPTPTFTQDLWAAGAATYDQILVHPFLSGLADGSLPRECFAYYLAQDSHYLLAYARALSLVSARASTEDAVRLFAEHASGAIAVEQDLHARLLGELGLEPGEVQRTPVGPTTAAYSSYLLATAATGSYAEAVAAVLPCYWVYRDVGKELAARSSPDPAYATWIATYGSGEFDVIVADVLAVTDALGAELGEAERRRCLAHFATATRYEWMFWDAAYRRLQWPV
ncbi:MAG: transcriptional activator, TenA family [Friedmanniella sp.]|nr:transcriptional activator, TenA family [Friedmanniella sp.]